MPALDPAGGADGGRGPTPRRRPRRRRRRVLALLLAAAVTTGGCEPSPGADASPEAVVRAFLGALEAQEVERAMSHLDDGFVFRDAEGTFTAGREAMPDMLAWDAAAEGRFEIEELESEGETVRVRLREENRFTELLALEPWHVEATFRVREGRITEEIARELSDGGPSFTERFERALEPVMRWAREARADEAAAIFEKGGVARYDGPTARRLLRVIEEYRDARGPTTESSDRPGGPSRPPDSPRDSGFLETSDGVRLHWTTRGRGEDPRGTGTVVVPGAWMLADPLETLPADHGALFYDMRSRGRSDRVEDPARLGFDLEHGARDHVAPPEGGREWAAALPDARFEAIEDAGHLLWAERPAQVRERILAFLEAGG